MRGLSDGAVQLGVPGLEGLEPVGLPATVQTSPDPVEVGLSGDPGGERGHGRLEDEPDLHDLGGAGVGRCASSGLDGGLGEEGSAPDVADDHAVALEDLESAPDRAAWCGESLDKVALGGQLRSRLEPAVLRALD